MSAIAIIGGGWLGQPLAQKLTQHSFTTFVSKTSEQGLEELSRNGISGFELELPLDNTKQKNTFINNLLKREITTIIGCFPPGFRKGLSKDYLYQWQSLVECAKAANVKKVIMTSSTTVYPNEAKVMKETHATLSLASDNPIFSDNARIMLQAEDALIHSGLNYVIVRCAGLFGPNRPPGRFVSKLPKISALAPVNMLHLNDAIHVVLFSINQLNDQIVNASSPTLVNKVDFYRIALSLYDNTLDFPQIVHIADKQISSDKLIDLGFEFEFENAIDGLTRC